MKKKDIYFLIIVLILAGIGYFGYNFLTTEPTIAKVYYQNEVVLEFDINKDAQYDIEGDYGTFHLEVKDEQYRAINVECPNHTCEEEGWVKKGEVNRRITCAPNMIFVIQEVQE